MGVKNFSSFKSSFESYILLILIFWLIFMSSVKWKEFQKKKQKIYLRAFLTFINHLIVMLYLQSLILAPKSSSV